MSCIRQVARSETKIVLTSAPSSLPVDKGVNHLGEDVFGLDQFHGGGLFRRPHRFPAPVQGVLTIAVWWWFKSTLVRLRGPLRPPAPRPSRPAGAASTTVTGRY